MNVHERNALIIRDASFQERIDYKATNGVEGFYIYDRRDGSVIMHKTKMFDHRAIAGFDWKDAT